MGSIGKANNYGMMRFAHVHSAKTDKTANKDSNSSKVNFAPVKLANTEATMATASPTASSTASWKTSIATDSARREKTGMVKVTKMVENYESKGEASNVKAEGKVSVGRAPDDTATVSSLAAKFGG